MLSRSPSLVELGPYMWVVETHKMAINYSTCSSSSSSYSDQAIIPLRVQAGCLNVERT